MSYYKEHKGVMDVQSKDWAKNNPESRKAIYHRSYLKHRDKINQKIRDWKIWAVEYMGGRCADCKGIFPVKVYDFHHLNPEEKDMKPSMLRYYAKERAIKELAKCIMLCANCHRIRHSEEL